MQQYQKRYVYPPIDKPVSIANSHISGYGLNTFLTVPTNRIYVVFFITFSMRSWNSSIRGLVRLRRLPDYGDLIEWVTHTGVQHITQVVSLMPALRLVEGESLSHENPDSDNSAIESYVSVWYYEEIE